MSREYWIVNSEMKDCPDGKTRVCRTENPELDTDVDPKQWTHVVEYSELTKWKECAEKLARMMGAYKGVCDFRDLLAEYEKLLKGE